MYTPRAFEITDPAVLHPFIERYSFATLITGGAGSGANEPWATHLPLLLDRQRGPHGTLIGHVARANPHWRHFDGAATALAIFHGPHAYVSPSWYREPAKTVPTWNYAVVHAYGRPQAATDSEFLPRLLARMVALYESGRQPEWSTDLGSPANEKLMAAVVGFEMPIARLEGKFKFNQNRDASDQRGAAAGLEAAGDPESAAVAKMMRQYLGLGDQ